MLKDDGKVSAGILLYCKNKVFLVHLGGPKFERYDYGYWGIPKGIVEPGEDLKETAIREFREETGIHFSINPDHLRDVGNIITARGKIVNAFILEGFGTEKFIGSNTCMTEWPLNSGKMIEIPECDKGEWFNLQQAHYKINVKQRTFLTKLKKLIEQDQ